MGEKEAPGRLPAHITLSVLSAGGGAGGDLKTKIPYEWIGFRWDLWSWSFWTKISLSAHKTKTPLIKENATHGAEKCLTAVVPWSGFYAKQGIVVVDSVEIGGKTSPTCPGSGNSPVVLYTTALPVEMGRCRFFSVLGRGSSETKQNFFTAHAHTFPVILTIHNRLR